MTWKEQIMHHLINQKLQERKRLQKQIDQLDRKICTLFKTFYQSPAGKDKQHQGAVLAKKWEQKRALLQNLKNLEAELISLAEQII